jgi:hypothetical protein
MFRHSPLYRVPSSEVGSANIPKGIPPAYAIALTSALGAAGVTSVTLGWDVESSRSVLLQEARGRRSAAANGAR